MIYVIDHYYAANHKDYCIVVESNRSSKSIMEICVALQFLLEDLTDDSNMLDMNCLKLLLCDYYSCVDVKDKYKEYLEIVDINNAPEQMILLEMYDNILITRIDLYEARESLCGPNHRKCIDKYIPEGSVREEISEILKRDGVER